MAINYELINKGGISLGTNFELLSEKPLDSRLVVPSLDGLQNYIDNAAAYEGLIAYVSSEKKHYEVKVIDGVLSYRPFGLTAAELNDLITNATTAAMEFKGATATIPENPAKGDMYKVAGENINIKIDDVDAKLGDSIVYDGTKWFLIPSGDDIEDTWRPVEGVNNDATLKFVDGDKTVAAVAADGTIKYNHATVTAPVDVTAEGDEQTRTYITAVETDGYGHITGYKTATENVEDTNTEYTFESQVESSSVYFNVTPDTEGATEQTVYVDAYSKNEADGKFVAKETGKSLVSDTEIARLAEVDNYDDEAVRGLISDNAKAIDDLEAYVGTIPTDEKYADITNVISYVNKKAEETLAAAQGGSSETAASVKQQLDNYKSENDTRVKAVEDDIDAINNADTGILKLAKDYANSLAGNYDEAGAAAGVKSYVDGELAKKVNTATYTEDKATFATKTELGDVDKKFADYRTSADQDAIDDDHKERIEALEAKFTGDNSVDAKIAAAVDVEKQRAEGIEGGLRTDVNAVAGRMTAAEGKITALEGASATHATKDELNAVDAKFADYTKTTDLPTDLGDFTNNAGYAKSADVNVELGKKADKTQVATDIANAIAPLATTEALNGVKATAEAAAVKTEVEAALALKADKTALEATDKTLADVKTTVDNFFSDDAAINDTIDTLKEIATYIATDKEGAANITARVGALEGKVDVDKVSEAIDADVKAAIDAEVLRANSAYDATGAAAAAQAAAIADAASKYETKGTAQGIVDALKLSETYEPIGAESRAIAAAESKVNALAGNVYTKTETYTKSEIDALFTWGEF